MSTKNGVSEVADNDPFGIDGTTDDGGVAVAEATEQDDSPSCVDETSSADDGPSINSLNASHLNELREKEAECDRLECEMEEAKGDLARAKKKYEVAIEELRGLIRQGPNRQPELPFGSDEPEATPSTPATDESWREVHVSTLDLDSGIEKALIEADLETIGKIADWTAGGNHQLIDIPGIGEAKAKKIDDAIDAFWTRRHQLNSQAVPIDESTDAA